MNRFEQRLQEELQDPEFAQAFHETRAEVQLLHALDMARKHAKMSHEKVAQRMGKKRASINRLLTTQAANPKLETIIQLLSALELTADITIRHAEAGEEPIHVVTEIE